jgi:hypothetical protein
MKTSTLKQSLAASGFMSQNASMGQHWNRTMKAMTSAMRKEPRVRRRMMRIRRRLVVTRRRKRPMDVLTKALQWQYRYSQKKFS